MKTLAADTGAPHAGGALTLLVYGGVTLVRGMPVFIFAGECDDIYVMPLEERSYRRFKTQGGLSVTWHVEPGLRHAARSVAEPYYCAKWLARVLLGEEYAVAHSDAVHAMRADRLSKQLHWGCWA